MAMFPKSNSNMFSIFFHTKDMLWHKWDYEIDKYDITGDKEKPVPVLPDTSKLTGEDDESVERDGEMSPMSGGMQDNDEFQDKVEY